MLRRPYNHEDEETYAVLAALRHEAPEVEIACDCNETRVRCDECDDGDVECPGCENRDEARATCEDCGGDGWLTCWQCSGTGSVKPRCARCDETGVTRRAARLHPANEYTTRGSGQEERGDRA